MADNEDRNQVNNANVQNNKDDDNAADKAAKYATQLTNNAFTGAKDIASKTTSKVGEELSSAFEKSKEMLSNPNVFYGLIAVIVIAIICVIVIHYFIAESVFNKKHTIIEKTKFPVKGNVKSKISIDNFPTSGNGIKKTYTFWIYVQDMSNSPGRAKHIFSIGDGEDSTRHINSPIVFISKDNNCLCIAFPSTTSGESYEAIMGWNPSDTASNITNKVYFDYLPLQRWVHIAVVIHDNHEGAQVFLYMDSKLVKNVTHNEGLDTGTVLKFSESGTKYELKNFNIDKTGMLIVGGNEGLFPGFNGLISKVGIYNYELNSRDIYQIYNQGPIDGLLASLGYGVRTPVYKLTD